MLSSPDAPASHRDVERLSSSVDKLTKALDAMRVMMEMTYLRQDVYHEAQKLHDLTHKGQEKDTNDLRADVEGLQENNRWVWRTIVVSVATVLVPALITGLALVITGGLR